MQALLLVAAVAFLIVSSFLTFNEQAQHLVNPKAHFDGTDSTVNVISATAWSASATGPGVYQATPLTGWADVFVSVFALVAALLLVVGRGQWAWAKPLTALASGLLAGVVLISVLRIFEAASFDFREGNTLLVSTAGPAVWLLLPAGLIALVAGFLALRANRPYGYMANQIAM